MTTPTENMTLLVTRPGGDDVLLVIAIIIDPEHLNIEKALSGIVPEMAKGHVRGGLLVVGDSTLVLRNMGDEIAVDEVHTDELLALGDFDDHWTRETILPLMQAWISALSQGWRDRLEEPLRDLLVPHIVAGLNGDISVHEGVWGMDAHRVASVEEP